MSKAGTELSGEQRQQSPYSFITSFMKMIAEDFEQTTDDTLKQKKLPNLLEQVKRYDANFAKEKSPSAQKLRPLPRRHGHRRGVHDGGGTGLRWKHLAAPSSDFHVAPQ